MSRKKILCLGGSLNQTSQLHLISQYLSTDHDIYFSQVFGDGFFYKFMAESGISDNTVLGKNSSFNLKSLEYLKENNAKYDYRGNTLGIDYDLVIVSTDLVFPSSFKSKKTAWVQEGMIDPLKPSGKWIKRFHLPLYFTSDTSLNGTSNKADLYFAMSAGYKKYFNKHGTNANKILTTGVPNFDNIEELKHNDIELKDFVLVATSDIRELGGNEDRLDFIKQCLKIANGKKLIFKPHPNENINRAISEINMIAPNAEILTSKNLDFMIANCDTLITQFSSCVYLGLVLEKKVYSYFPIEELEANKPIQNKGTSAQIIAGILEKYLYFDGTGVDFINQDDSVKKYL